jgi:ribonuclease Z
VSLSVQFIGTGSALPKKNANPSCQYVFCENRHFLIDCGEGTQIQLRKHGVKFQYIQGIFISHLHGDHYFGLVGLLSSMHLLGREKAIDIYSPPELEQIVRSQLELGGARLAFDIRFHNIEKNDEGIVFEDKVLEVHAFKLKHKIPTHGFIFKEKKKLRSLLGEKFHKAGLSIAFIEKFKLGEDVIDRQGKQHSYLDYTANEKPSYSYAYCSDTAYSENVISWLKDLDVDVLYHEATFSASEKDRAKKTMHSTSVDAGTVAAKSGVKFLFFGHLSARYDYFNVHIDEILPVFKSVKPAIEGEKYRIEELLRQH